MTAQALKIDDVAPRKSNVDAILVAALLLLGIYFPTSIEENISQSLYFAGSLLTCVIFFGFLAKSSRWPSFLDPLVPLSIVPLLVLFTFSSGFSTYTPGALIGYILLSILYLLNLREVAFPQGIRRVYITVSIINILIAFAIIAHVQIVDDFIVNHFSWAYPELVPNMLSLRKPVLTFGTHSLAAFYLYLFFYAHLETWKRTTRSLFLVFTILHLLMIFALLSVSGLMLGSLGIVQLLYALFSSRNLKALFGAIIFLILAVSAGFKLLAPEDSTWHDFGDAAKAILTTESSGFLGRVGPEGLMYYDLRYLRMNPLNPVGVSFREGLMFGDSGPVEHLLRGSIFLLFSVYFGLYLFLKRNLLAKPDLYFLFFVILAFEFGYSSLVSFRTLCLLPFLVVYLNGLRRKEKDEMHRPMKQMRQTVSS